MNKKITDFFGFNYENPAEIAAVLCTPASVHNVVLDDDDETFSSSKIVKTSKTQSKQQITNTPYPSHNWIQIANKKIENNQLNLKKRIKFAPLSYDTTYSYPTQETTDELSYSYPPFTVATLIQNDPQTKEMVTNLLNSSTPPDVLFIESSSNDISMAALINSYAVERGITIYEMNTTNRAYKTIDDFLQIRGGQRSSLLNSINQTTSSFEILLIDEIDCMFKEDRRFLASLNIILKGNSDILVVCTHSIAFKHLESLSYLDLPSNIKRHLIKLPQDLPLRCREKFIPLHYVEYSEFLLGQIGSDFDGDNDGFGISFSSSSKFVEEKSFITRNLMKTLSFSDWIMFDRSFIIQLENEKRERAFQRRKRLARRAHTFTDAYHSYTTIEYPDESFLDRISLNK